MKLIYGNAYHGDLEELWNNEAMQKIRDSLLSGDRNRVCKECIGDNS